MENPPRRARHAPSEYRTHGSDEPEKIGTAVTSGHKVVSVGHDTRAEALLQPELLSRVTPAAVSEHFSELLGCPISRSLTAYCVCLKLRLLPSTGITRLPRCLRTSPPPQGA